jgi:hypothetical protein
MNRLWISGLITVVFAILTACGGGGSSTNYGAPPPATSHTATVKLATSGTPSAQLAGLEIVVTLPAGVTPPLNSDGSVAGSDATVSGVAAPGSMVTPVYTPASGTSKATLRLVLASKNTAGFGAGEFATLTLTVAPGATLSQSDFAFSELTPVDVDGHAASGLTAGVANLSVQ